jgi:hypothetical protein
LQTEAECLAVKAAYFCAVARPDVETILCKLDARNRILAAIILNRPPKS